MRKFISILLVMILCMTVLSACTGGESSVTPEETTESATDKPDQTTQAPTETPPPDTEPIETDPPETEPPAPVDPSELHFAPEDYPVIDGSTATKPLAKAFQEALTGEEGVEINHSKTGKAYTKLVDGEVDLILVVEPSEDNKAYADEHHVTLKLSKVANEGFVFFVNKRNPINSLTADQIRRIYSGEITNWKEVGGNDAEIVAFQRPVNSGSQTGMESIVMGDTPLMEPVTEHIAGSMEDIIDVISAFDGGENAIGYSYYYYANTMYLGENIKMIGVDGVMPNNTTICDMEYPFLTAYYAVTRKGDENTATRDLLAYMLSEYGQVNVRDAGYVPIFDVGTAPSGDKEASNERTIHLSDTYNRASIRTTRVEEERDGSRLAYFQIEGLKNTETESKINKLLRDHSEEAFSEALEKAKDFSKEAKVYQVVYLSGAFADILSVDLRVTVSEGGRWFTCYRPINLKLSDGEEICFRDLFTADTEGKDIFNATTYSRILPAIAELGYETGPITIEDYNDVEDAMFDWITRFNTGGDFHFTVDPGSFTIYPEVNGEEKMVTLYLEQFMEKVTLYSRFLSDTDLYTGEYPAEKAIPVLIQRLYTETGTYEKTDHYYINMGVQILPENEEYKEAFLKLFDQREALIFKEAEEVRKEGKYLLYEGFFHVFEWDGKFDETDVYQMSGDSYSVKLILDSEEEFENVYEKIVTAWRAYHGDEGGLYPVGMDTLRWYDPDFGTGKGFDFIQHTEGLYYLKGYKAIRPYKEHRIKLEDLEGQDAQTVLELLKKKGLKLPEVYSKNGNEAMVAGMVVSEILEHPERLTERNWTYQDIWLLEAADRIADCIKP